MIAGDIPLSLVLISIVIGFWALLWKGIALYRSARRGENIWFVCLLIFETMGILPIFYLLFVDEEFTRERRKRKAGKRNLKKTKKIEKKKSLKG